MTRTNRVTWTSASAGSGSPPSAITNYEIWRATTALGSYSLAQTVGDVNLWDDTLVADNQDYFYKVLATNAVGDGALSDYAGVASEQLTWDVALELTSEPTYTLDVALALYDIEKTNTFDVVLQLADITADTTSFDTALQSEESTDLDIEVVLVKYRVPYSYTWDVVVNIRSETLFPVTVVTKLYDIETTYTVDTALQRLWGITHGVDISTAIQRLDISSALGFTSHVVEPGLSAAFTEIEVLLKAFGLTKTYTMDVATSIIASQTFDITTVLALVAETLFPVDTALKLEDITADTFTMDTAINLEAQDTITFDTAIEKSAPTNLPVDTGIVLEDIQELMDWDTAITLEDLSTNISFDIAVQIFNLSETYSADVAIELERSTNLLIDLLLQGEIPTTFDMEVAIQYQRDQNLLMTVATQSEESFTSDLDVVLMKPIPTELGIESAIKAFDLTHGYNVDTAIQLIDIQAETTNWDTVIEKTNKNILWISSAVQGGVPTTFGLEVAIFNIVTPETTFAWDVAITRYGTIAPEGTITSLDVNIDRESMITNIERENLISFMERT